MNILTFDIEEWFHILDNDSTKSEKNWINYESRIHKNMEKIFDILESTNTKASFFVLGWIAEKYPEIIRSISDKGFEIGSHSTMHQLVYQQDKNQFKTDVDRSIKTLEDISGKKVKMFRAPGFSIKENNKWAFEILYELGIDIDSSVFPAKRAHGGLPSYGASEPSILQYNGVQLKEFPINTKTILGKTIIYSGGGYFRLAPYSILKKWSKKDDYIMSYFHPRDFDSSQPVIESLSLTRKFKSYVGLKNSETKLKKWLKDFDFTDIESANKKINWDKAKIVNL